MHLLDKYASLFCCTAAEGRGEGGGGSSNRAPPLDTSLDGAARVLLYYMHGDPPTSIRLTAQLLFRAGAINYPRNRHLESS